MSNEKVSVIMPTRNAGAFIVQGLGSILAQTLRPIEILVIDGQSTDATPALASRYREVAFLPQESHGLSAALNEGIRAARGDWIAILEADDWWEPNKLEAQLRFHRDRPEVRCSLTWATCFLEPGCGLPPNFEARFLDHPHGGSYLSCLLAHREVFEKAGYFDESLKVAMDLDWVLRAKDSGYPEVFVREALVHKRIHGSNHSLFTPGARAERLKLLHASVMRKRAGS